MTFKKNYEKIALAPLIVFTPHQWSQWLESRLSAFYSPENSYAAFAFKFPDLGITDTDSIFDAVSQLWEMLSPSAKIAFQEGLTELISRWRDRDQPDGAFSDLLGFVAIAQASKAIPVIVDKAFSNEIDRARLYDIIALLKGLSDWPVAHSEAKRVCEIPSLPSPWLIDLLEVSIQTLPRNWIETIIKFDDKVSSRENEYLEFGISLEDIALRLWGFCRAGVVQTQDLLDGITILKTYKYHSNFISALCYEASCDPDPIFNLTFIEAENVYPANDFSEIIPDTHRRTCKHNGVTGKNHVNN